MSAPTLPGGLPGTDEFIEHCEHVRAWNYMLRAEAQARLGPPIQPAGSAVFGGARVWFAGARARVHLLTGASLEQLPALEAWLAERGLDAGFDVVPTLATRPVALELARRGYQLVAWQPSLYRSLAVPVDTVPEAVEVEEVSAADSDFPETFLAGYEIPSAELEHAAIVSRARWRAESARCFLARIEGKPIAAATLVVCERSARLANCATLPQFRNLGAQSALIRARLRCAAALGLELAVSDARQGGSSLRNLTRSGFALSAHITQWKKAGSAHSA